MFEFSMQKTALSRLSAWAGRGFPLIWERDMIMKELVTLALVFKHYKGYTYFWECIGLVRENEAALTAVIKELYLPVALKNNTSCSCVERDIRTFCKIVWEHGGRAIAAGYGLSAPKQVPANHVCIEMVAALQSIDQADEG